MKQMLAALGAFVLLASGCFSGGGTKGASATSAGKTSSTTFKKSSPTPQPDVTAKYTDINGNSETLTLTLGTPVPVNKSDAPLLSITNCAPRFLPGNRTLLQRVDGTMTVTNADPPSATVDFQWGDYVRDTNPPSCANNDDSLVLTNALPHKTRKFTIWVIYPDAITPIAPQGDLAHNYSSYLTVPRLPTLSFVTPTSDPLDPPGLYIEASGRSVVQCGQGLPVYYVRMIPSVPPTCHN